MPSWVCQSKPFQIPVGDSFKKALVEERVLVSGDSSDGQNVMDFPVLHSTDHSDYIPVKQFDLLPWELLKPYVWERIEAPLRPLRPWPECNFSHPRQLCPFPERLELPFSNDEILSGYEEIVSSGTDLLTTWIKMSHHEVLEQHMVDFHKATADFRMALERKPCTSPRMNSGTLLPVRLCRGDSASTTGTLYLNGCKMMLSNSELQEGVSQTKGENWKDSGHQPCPASGTNSTPASWKNECRAEDWQWKRVQNSVWLQSGIPQVYATGIRIFTIRESWGSQSQERIYFYDTLLFGQ